MKVVVDTNVFVESLSRTSPYHAIFQNLVDGRFFICFSNPILLEYQEILSTLHRQENADRLLDFLTISPFALPFDPHYHFHLIAEDPDDNKFVDCAFAANADYIVTSDHHFDVLQNIEFPKIQIIKPEAFIELPQ